MLLSVLSRLGLDSPRLFKSFRTSVQYGGLCPLEAFFFGLHGFESDAEVKAIGPPLLGSPARMLWQPVELLSPEAISLCKAGAVDLTFATGAAEAGFTVVAGGAVAAEAACLGQMNLPFWLRTMRSFSLSDRLPSRVLMSRQQATQLWSALLPPLACATRCSTVASSLGKCALQKKQALPWANNSRSSGLIPMIVSTSCVRPGPTSDLSNYGNGSWNCGLDEVQLWHFAAMPWQAAAPTLSLPVIPPTLARVLTPGSDPRDPGQKKIPTFPVLLPRVSYVTRMDRFILLSTLMVFAGLLQTVASTVMVRHQNKKLAVRLDHRARIIYPVVFGLVLAVSFVI